MIFIYNSDAQTNHMDRKSWNIPCDENSGICGFSVMRDATYISELMDFVALTPYLTNLDTSLNCKNAL